LFAEFLEKRLVKQVLDVLRIIKCGRRARCTRCLLLIAWLARIDSFPDAELAKIRETDLELADCLSSRDEVLGLASGTCLEILEDIFLSEMKAILPFFFILAIAAVVYVESRCTRFCVVSISPPGTFSKVREEEIEFQLSLSQAQAS
jgi:hypothetical protein